MSLVLATSVIATAPATVDGRGEVATLNDSTSGTFVGRVLKTSGFGGAAIRTSIDNKPEGHGSLFGSFWYAHRPFTLEVQMMRAATWALSDARYNKLCRAFDAMADDGTVVFTDTDTIVKRILFRQEQTPTDPDEQGHVLLGGVCEDPRITANAATTVGAGTFTVGGTAGASPTFTITSPTNTIVLTRTSPTPAEALTFTGLSGAGTVTVDFGARTVTATSGAADRYSAVSFPSSVFWELIPGSNTVTVSGGTVSGSGISYRTSWRSV